MENLVFLIKSYNRHLHWTKQLIESIYKHNKDNIKIYLSVPKQDKILFKEHKKNIGKALTSIYYYPRK